MLVLDEATAHVDMQTDALIQGCIRRRFARCTVLTVAHRLSTLIDSDKLMVMGGGRLLEYDSPHTLLEPGHPTRHFADMVDSTGPESARTLREAARAAAASRREAASDGGHTP